MAYRIFNPATNSCLSSGTYQYDGNIYLINEANIGNMAAVSHNEIAGGSVQWEFISYELDGEEVYQIRDTAYQKALVAGNVADGHVYLQDFNDQLNGLWRVEETPVLSDEISGYIITDLKHSMYLTSSNAGHGGQATLSRAPTAKHLPNYDENFSLWVLIEGLAGIYAPPLGNGG